MRDEKIPGDPTHVVQISKGHSPTQRVMYRHHEMERVRRNAASVVSGSRETYAVLHASKSQDS